MNVKQNNNLEDNIPLEKRTLIKLKLVSQGINEHISKTLKPFEISIQQYKVLSFLGKHCDQPANLSSLNCCMLTKMSNTTRLVDKLLLKNYVERSVCPSNRRKIEIKITKKGQTDLCKMNSAVQQTEKELLKNISVTELEQLNILLNKF